MQNITYTVTINSSIKISDCLVHFELSTIGPVFHNLKITALNGVIASDEIINTLTKDTPTYIDVYRLQSSTIYVTIVADINSPKFIDSSVNNLVLKLRDQAPVTSVQFSGYIDMLPKYSPIRNFYNGSGSYKDDINYSSPFTVLTDIGPTSDLDLKLQTSYDGSVNMIFTADNGIVRLVNSRFIVNKDSTQATLADRYAKKDTNTYSEKYFYRTKLIPAYASIAKLEFNGVFNNGILKSGANRYYFRYVTADGAETDIIEESRLVSIHEGNDPTSSVGVLNDGPTSKSVKFTLSNLDTTFKGVVLYYTHISGEAGVIPTSYRLMEPFNISKGICVITHTGYEQIEDVSNELVGIPYSKIGEVSTLELTDDRLLLANSNLSSTFNIDHAALATKIITSEETFQLSQSKDIAGTDNNNYSNPEISYSKVGYWPGETEELGVIFITDNGLSSVYPVQGIDNLDGDAKYDFNKIGVMDSDFDKISGQNSMGVYRTKNSTKPFWKAASIITGDLVHFDNIALVLDISKVLGFNDTVTAYKVADRVNNDITVLVDRSHTGELTYDVYGTLADKVAVGESNSIIGLDYDTEATVSMTYTDPINGLNVTALWDISHSELTLSSLTYDDATTTTAIPDGVFLSSGNIERVLPEGINGYFFVRRKRIADRILQGISVPVATMPSMTNSIAERAIASPGNYLGIGTENVVGSGASTKVPVPLCMMPFGFETTPSGKKLKELDDDSAYTEQRTHTDFILRAPVLDKTSIKALALYSPEIDTSTVAMATRMADTKVDTVINTSIIGFTPHTIDSQPLRNNTMLDYVTLETPTTRDATVKSSATANYIDSGITRTGTYGFSSSADRTLYLYTNSPVTQEESDTAVHADINFTHYINDTDADTNPFLIDSEFKEVVSGVPAMHADSSIVQTDSNMEEARTPGIGVNYGRYLGLSLKTYNTDLAPLYYLESGTHNVNVQSTLRTSVAGQSLAFTATDTLGFLTDVYPEGQGGPLTKSSWLSRYSYDGNTEYVAITRRYDINESVPIFLSVYGGDCYTGIQWKQVWSPKGIPGLPNATDVNAFLLTREGLGLLDYGFAIPIPARSNNNFFIRTPERADELEWKVWGKDRSYLPVNKDIRGNKQKDTSLYNLGYSANYYTANKYFKVNSNFPFILDKYPNRVYASDPASNTEFKNGITSFRGLNFKDYNFELGPIRRLAKLKDYVVVVFDSGVGLIQVKESTMVSKDNAGVYVDNIHVLPEKLHIVSSLYGTQHKNSIVETDNSIYGVDLYNKLIWKISPNKYGGMQLSELSTKKVQTLLTQTINEMNAVYDEWKDNQQTVNIWKNVRASYDKQKHDIYFTFTVYLEIGADKLTKYSKSIVYNDLIGLWITRTDNDVIFSFPIKNERMLFTASSFGNLLKFNSKLYHTKDKEYNIFDGKYYDAEIQYVIKGKGPINRTIDNIILHGINSVPETVIYNTDKLQANKIQTLYKATNVTYESENTVVSGTIGNAYIDFDPVNLVKWNGEPLSSGDYVQFKVEGNDVQMIIRDFESNNTIMNLDKPLPGTITDKEPLRIGYYTDEMITNTIVEQQETKITCRFDSSENGEFRPEGTKARVNLIFSGSSFVTVSSIFTISDTIQS